MTANLTCAGGESLPLGHYAEGNCSAQSLADVYSFSVGFLVAHVIVLSIALLFLASIVGGKAYTVSGTGLLLYVFWVAVTVMCVAEYGLVLQFNMSYFPAKLIEWFEIVLIISVRLASTLVHRKSGTSGLRDKFVWGLSGLALGVSIVGLVVYWVKALGNFALLIGLLAWFFVVQAVDTVFNVMFLCSSREPSLALRFAVTLGSLAIPVVGIAVSSTEGRRNGYVCFALGKLVLALSGYVEAFYAPGDKTVKVEHMEEYSPIYPANNGKYSGLKVFNPPAPLTRTPSSRRMQTTYSEYEDA